MTLFRRALIGLATSAAVVASTAGVSAASTLTVAKKSNAPHNLLLKQLLSLSEHDQPDSPALSALCQNFVGKPNPYAPPGPNVGEIRGDTIVQVGSQTGCSSAQNETTIAVNPENPRNLVAGTNDYRLYNSREDRNDAAGFAYTTFNGGKTWTDVQLPHLTFQTGATGALSYMDSAGDPVVSFGPHNTVYYGNILFSRAAPASGGSQAASALAVSVSHDGGKRWGEPVVVRLDGVDSAGTATPTNYFNDKIWLAADKTSGRVYVTWTRFTYDADGNYLESPIVAAASHNYGRSFAGYRRVDVPHSSSDRQSLVPYSQGSNPQVARDGTLYVAYEGSVCVSLACDQPTDRDVTVVARSGDHGRTFSRAVVGTNYDFPFNEALGTLTLTGENFRINAYPQLAYDQARNLLVVTWSDDRNGSYDATTGESVRTNGDNIVSSSPDGRHWSAPAAIGTPQDEVFAAVAAQAGVVAVTSYTRHYNPSGINLDYAYWTDGARSGSPIHRITTQSSSPRIQFVGVNDEGATVQGVFIGDYSAAALGRDLRLHPSWTDFRGRPGVTGPNQDAYTQAIQLH